jgi:hypothetical protein
LYRIPQLIVVFAATAPLITYYTPVPDDVKADYLVRKVTGCIPELRYTSAPLLCSLFTSMYPLLNAVMETKRKVRIVPTFSIYE